MAIRSTGPSEASLRRLRAPHLVVAALCLAVVLPVVSLASAAPVAASASHPVMSTSRLTAAQLAGWYRSTGKVSKATVSIDALTQMFIEEGAAEGVAGDLAFAQSIVETGYFGFSTRVPASFNNFSGLGAVDGGTSAASFPTARVGVRAQIQHLRAYADPNVTVASLANPLVDPRFNLVVPKGKARTWEEFGNGIWATDPGYAAKVIGIHDQILAWAGIDARWAPHPNPAAVVGAGYRELLWRPPTASEARTASDALVAGRLSVSGFLSSLVAGEGAAHAQPVARLYLAALGRDADPSGQRYWTVRHREGTPLVRLAGQFLGSAEFGARYGDVGDGEFVDVIYLNVLGRSADPTGAAYWLRRLADGSITRAELLVQFSESSEHRNITAARVELAVVYLGMLGRAPDPSAISWWATKRSQGAGLALLLAVIYTSSDYAARVGGT